MCVQYNDIIYTLSTYITYMKSNIITTTNNCKSQDFKCRL